MPSDVRVASPIGQSDGGATTARLSLAWMRSLSSSRAAALSLRSLNPVAPLRRSLWYHVFVHDDMAATAGAGASLEWVAQLLLVRGSRRHACCVRPDAPLAEQAKNVARSDSRPKCEPAMTQRCAAFLGYAATGASGCTQHA